MQVPAGSPEGLYYVTGSVGVCPIVPDSVEVEVLPVPAAPDLTGPGVWCQGLGDWIGTGAAADAGGYLWSGPGVAPGSNAGDDAIWVVPGAGGAVYGLAVTVAGCTSPVTTLSVAPVPLYTVDLPPGPLAVCLGGSVEVTAPGGAPVGADWSWSWAGGTAGGGGTAAGGVVSWEAVDAQDAGWVVLNGTADGCAFAPDSVLLDVLIPLIPALNLPDVVCNDDAPFPLLANGPGTWTVDCAGCWNPATGLVEPGLLPMGDVVVTFVSNPPCPVTASAMLEVGVTQDASFSAPVSVCIGVGTVPLQADVSGGEWSAECGNCLASNGNFNVVQAGPGAWEITYSFPGVCPTSSSVELLVTPNAVSDFAAPAVLCIDGSAVGLTPVVTGGEWAADCGPCVNAGGQFLPTLAGEGDHLITYTLPGICGSSTVVPIAVEPLPQVSLNLSDFEGCAPLVVDATASATIGGASGSGLAGGLQVTSLDFPSPPLLISGLNPGAVVLEEPGCYLWEAIATSPNGCVGTAEAPGPVCVFAQPSSGFTTTPEVPTLFAPQVEAEAVMTDPEDSHTWLLDNEIVEEGTTFSFHALTAAAPPYPLCLRVVSAEGCVSQTCKNISVNEGWVIYAPNAFTPDMDGVNDAWRIAVAGMIERFDLRVFDRWGQEVFATQDPEEHWVGEVQGGAYFAPATVYTWRLELAGRDVRGGTQVQVFEGHVSLLR